MTEASEIEPTGVTERRIDYEGETAARTFTAEERYDVTETLAAGPLTMEVMYELPKTYKSRAGVLIGTYDNGKEDQVNVEIYTSGKPRLYYKTKNKAYTIQFDTDVRTDYRRMLAMTIEGLEVKLYVDGELKESKELEAPFPAVLEDYCIASDRREGNAQYFKGTIYGAHMFSDVRTEEEQKLDRIIVPTNEEDLLYSMYFAEQ